jgi:hypothetical protein
MTRKLIGIILVFAVFAGLGVLGWHFTKERIRSQPQYQLSADKITVSPSPPDWIPEGFIDNVLQSAGLDQPGMLLDPTLPQKLRDAFTASPWVEKVERVDLVHPGAKIDISFRVPVALVKVQQKIFPVDRLGFVLPSEYLTYLTESVSDKRSEILHIEGIQSTPLGSAGTPWGDPLVHSAAQLAGELADIAVPLKLKKISGTTAEWKIKTENDQTEIIWGTFAPDDPKNEAKKQRLWNLLETNPTRSQPIDLSRE